MAKDLKGFKKLHDPHTVIADLTAQLEEARSQAATAEAMREWVGAARLATSQVDIPQWMVGPRSAKSPGVPTIMLSDLHWGEKVDPKQIRGINSFNLAIARRRLKQTVETGIALAQILDADMRYPGVVVPLGGDMVSGNIHDELAATNELNTMPTVLDLYKHLVAGLRLLADRFGAVFVPCVTGNHDRDTKKTWGKDRHHTSFSWLLYQFLSIAFAEDRRVTFYIPDSADARFNVYGFRYLLTHGDEFKAGDSIIGPLGPLMRGEQKKLAAYSAAGDPYDCMLFGHWHTRYMWARGRGNGTLKGYDEFAAKNNFRPEPPSQNFWVTHPEHGMTWDAPIYCEPKSGRRNAPWAAIPEKT